MADIDLAFASAVQQGGMPALRSVLEAGFNSDLLEGEGRTAYLFIMDFYKQYSVIPSADVVVAETGIVLLQAPDPLPYLTNALYNRKLHFLLHDGLSTLTQHLTQQKPELAREHLEVLVRSIRNMDTRGAVIESLPALGTKVIEYYEKIKSGFRGIQTPWPTINEATMGFWPEDLALFAARSGIGKCQVFDTLCMDPETGLLHTIEEIYNTPNLSHIATWSKDGGIHVRPITQKHDTGHKACLKMVFATGRDNKPTPEHPYLTPEGWRRADELRVGDTVALPAHMPFPINPVSLEDHEIDVLAIMLADGACTSASDTRFTKRDPSIIARAEAAAKAFGVQLVESDGGADRRFSQGVGARTPNPVRTFLTAHGVMGVKSKDKHLPAAIFRLPKTQLARFISLFWMCDGYVDANGACIDLASEPLIRQLQHLLLRFGIQSSVDYKAAKNQSGVFDSWRLRIYSQFLPRFSQEIGLWGDKGARLQEHTQRKQNANVGFPRVSKELMDQIKAEAGPERGVYTDPKRTAATHRIADRLGRKSFSPKDLFYKHGDRYSVSLHGLEVYCEEFGCAEKYRWLWDSDIFWDTVEHIEDIGIQKIYDLTVEPTSCFVANDIIVHNTWAVLQIAGCAWEQGKKVLVATTEMTKERMALRYFAYKLKLPYADFRKGQLDIFTEQKFYNGVQQLMDSPNFNIVGGDFDFSMETFAGLVMDERPDMVLVDGAYLLRVNGVSRTEKAANVFDELKRLAKRSKAAVIATTQFNREVKVNQAKTVQAESIAMTDVAGWNADLIFGLVQTEEMKKNKRMSFKPLKIREGDAEEIECHWCFETMNFEEIPRANTGFSYSSTGSGVPSSGGYGYGSGSDGDIDPF